MSAEQTRLWHLPSSHYSEKVRWALDYKRVPHARRTPLVVPHPVVAARLTQNQTKTFPVLELHGEAIGDSTAIIEKLERLYPDPPLYPQDTDERARALELEEWFDEKLGPAIRILALGNVGKDPEALHDLSQRHVPAFMKPFPKAWAAQFARFTRLRYGLDRPGAMERAEHAVAQAFDKLEAELDGRDHLVGDTFTVADLAAASHLYWPIQPPEGPRIVRRLPPGLAEFMRQFEGRPGYRWVLDTYRRHRTPQPADKVGRRAERASMASAT